MKLLCWLLPLLFISTCLPSNNLDDSNVISKVNFEGARIHGLNFSAPPKPFEVDPMIDINAIGSNYVAVIPYGFTRQGTNKVQYNIGGFQWWGERPEGVQKTIELAKAANVSIMLKPQIYIPGGWTGGLDFEEEEDWQAWETGYRDFILRFAKMASTLDVELFCIGTEFKMSIQKREKFWRDLIKDVRKIYGGPITYAANWDEYNLVKFWDDLDYIGIDAYFPLTEEKIPEIPALKKKWKPIVGKIKLVSNQFSKPVLFTEYGYLSVECCADKTWELEAKVRECKINEQAQANALQALYEVFEKESFWAGGFLWKWYPKDGGHVEYPGRDYTPQGKIAYDIVKDFFNAKD